MDYTILLATGIVLLFLGGVPILTCFFFALIEQADPITDYSDFLPTFKDKFFWALKKTMFRKLN